MCWVILLESILNRVFQNEDGIILAHAALVKPNYDGLKSHNSRCSWPLRTLYVWLWSSELRLLNSRKTWIVQTNWYSGKSPNHTNPICCKRRVSGIPWDASYHSLTALQTQLPADIAYATPCRFGVDAGVGIGMLRGGFKNWIEKAIN